MARVIEVIEEMLHDYHCDHLTKPVGLVLGKFEYLELCQYLRRMHPEMKDATIAGLLVSEYNGLPVFLKEMPGVDLLIPHNEALR